MPETSVEQTQERELDRLVSRLVATARNPSVWQYGRCRIKPLAQDQVLFEVDRGDDWDTYKGLQVFSKDAQSDAGREVLKVPVTTDFDVWYQTCLILSAPEAAVAWPILEEDLGTDASFDAEPQSCEVARDDRPGIIDETADEWTSDRLADELLKLSVEKDWPRLRELILTAEDFDFTLDRSALLAPRLLELATQYRDSNDSQDAPVVWSAIRTGASMLRPSEASCLLALLEPGHPIETSLVALKMLGRIFEAQPPERPDQHTDLAGEVRGIAESLLNRYAIASPQSAAMAQLAVYALAAMASKEVLRVVNDVRRIGVSWFSQQTARELRGLQSSWDARSMPVAPEVLELLERATLELKAN